MPLTSPGNDDDTGENHQPTLRKNTAEPVEQTLKQNRLAMPCDRPNAWPNGLVREMLPDPLREWLDRQDEGERRGALRTLRRVDRESGWADAVGAMPKTLESTGGAGGDRRRASRG